MNTTENAMNVYNAIMKAADHIEREPKRFDFRSVRFPDCGVPGCALGWIGHYLGFKEAQGKEVLAVCSVLGTPALAHINCEFYDRMDALCGNLQWREKARICANTLRLYAVKYHTPATRTDAELVAYWTARVCQQHLDEHSKSEELAW